MNSALLHCPGRGQPGTISRKKFRPFAPLLPREHPWEDSMSAVSASLRRFCLSLVSVSGVGASLLGLSGLVITSGRAAAQVAVDDVADPEAEVESGVPEVPEIPDGTPEELMTFVDNLRKRNFRPTSRDQAMAFFKQVASTSVTVADKILGQIESDDEFFVPASRMKLESLTMLIAKSRGYPHDRCRVSTCRISEELA